MKILIIDQLQTPFRPNSVEGGSQVVVQWMKNLLEKSHDVTIYCNGRSEPGRGVVRSLDPHGNLTRTKKNELTALLDIGYDVVLNHASTSIPLLKFIHSRVEKTDGKFFTFIHNSVGFTRSIDAKLFAAEAIVKMSSERFQFVSVSETSMKEWLAVAQMMQAKLPELAEFPEVSEQFRLWFYPGTPSSMLNAGSFTRGVAGDYGVVVARPNKVKRIERVIRLHNQTNRRLRVVHTTPRNEDEVEYLAFLKSISSDWIEFYQDLPRSDVLKTIKESLYLCVSSKESYGLTAQEAGMNGIPLVVIDSRDNACLEHYSRVAEDEKFFLHLPNTFRSSHYTFECAIEDFRSLSHESKEKIASRFHRFYSAPSIHRRLENIFNLEVI